MRSVVLSSYAAQAYVGLVGIVLMPVYLRYMGVEAFGLVGFFVMLQAWLQLLDFGLSPCLSREMSRYRAGVLDAAGAWERLRCLEWILGSVALLVLVSIVAGRDAIATAWLSLKQLPSSNVATSVVAMAFAASFRGMSGIYRSALVGLERQQWVNGAAVVMTTLKFVGVIPLLAWWSAAPTTFFTYNAILAAVELVIFVRSIYRALPGRAPTIIPKRAALYAMVPIAGPMAFMSGMWVFLTQIDKLILSRVVSLDVFGYYSIAVAAASSVLTVLPPLSQVLQPRLTILAAQGRSAELTRLYCLATQFVTVVVTTAGGGLALLAGPVLWAWTGSEAVTGEAAPILFWYGLANGVIGLLVLPFTLQFAYGYLRLHVIGNIVMGGTLLPALAASAFHFGAVGAGATLFIANLIFLLCWVPLVYRRLAPDLIWRWLVVDVMPVALTILLVLAVYAETIPAELERFEAGVRVVVGVVLAAFVGILTGTQTRRSVLGMAFGKETA